MAELESQFGKLPMEMKATIFLNLSKSDRRSARLVCKIWSEAVCLVVKFRAVLSNDSMIEVLQSGTRHLHLYKLNVRDLTKGLPASSTHFDVFTRIKKLEFGSFSENPDGTTPENMRKLLIQCNNVEFLTFQPSGFGNYREVLFKDLEFLCLKTIKLVFFGAFTLQQKKAFIEITKFGPLPRLASIKFDMMFVDGFTGISYQAVYFALYEFIARHYKTLGKLEIKHPFMLPDPSNDFPHSELVMKGLQKCRLRSLTIGVINAEVLENWNYEKILLASQDQLDSLSIHGELFIPDFLVAIQKSQKTLQFLDCSLLDGFRVSIDCNCLHNVPLRGLFIPSIPTINFMAIPNTLVALVWCSSLKWDELIWLSLETKFIHLNRLILRDCNGLMPQVTVQILTNFLRSKICLELCWLDCDLTTEVKPYVWQHENNGLTISGTGLVRIDRSVFSVDRL